MTRKDYELIAKAFRDAQVLSRRNSTEVTDHVTFGAGYIASELATALAAINPRFDREKFLKACNP